MGERLKPLPEAKIEMLDRTVSEFEMELMMDDQAAAYLAGRGLSDETVSRFRLGLVPHDPDPLYSKYQGMLAIPYMGKDGRARGVRFRCIQDHKCKDFNHPKYNQLKGQPIQTFNGSRVWTAGSEIHITEGEFDAMTLEQAGLPTVGFPGAQSWKRHHRILFAGFDRVWVWSDPDEAGTEFLHKVTDALWMARAVPNKSGDVNETYLQGGKAALLDLIGA